MKNLLLKFFLFFVIVGANVSQAALINSDFLSANDGLLVTDTVTGIVWLSPFYTRGKSYNEVAGGYGDLLTTHGFQFATMSEVRSLISDNFDDPPIQPGNAAGYLSALTFFDVFGINELINCPAAIPPGPCPRTQAWAVDGGALTGLGMITLGDTVGGVIDFTASVASQGDIKTQQLGVWLRKTELAQSLEAGWWTQVFVRGCGSPRDGEAFPDCGNVQSELRISETDLGVTGSADSAFIQAVPESQSAASTGYTGEGFTPAISAYSYSALGERIITSAFGLQRYEFLGSGELTGSATFTYAQLGVRDDLPFLRSPVGFLKSGIITFRTENDLFEPAKCGVDDTTAGIALLGCLINEAVSQETNEPGLVYEGALEFVNFEFDDFESRPEGTTQTVSFSVTGLEGDVFFLTADMFIFANNGGFGDSRTTLELTLDNPELVQAAFQDETFVLAPPLSVGVNLDIVPGSDKNAVYLSSRGVTTAAILTRDTFDATQVDISTISLGPGGAPEAHGRSHFKDVDGDGGVDLILHFTTQDIGLFCGDADVTIMGETFDGLPFIGLDSISLQRCD